MLSQRLFAESMTQGSASESRSGEQLTRNQKHKLRKKLAKRHKVVEPALKCTHRSAREAPPQQVLA